MLLVLISNKNSENPLKNLLIISTTGMGDTLWGTPAIRAIKKELPHIAVDLLLQPQWKPLFYGNKNIRRLISYYPQWYRQLIELPKILKSHYDHVLIFHANTDMARIIPCLRSPSIWSNQYFDKFFGISKNKIVQFDKPVHGILRRMAMLEKIRIPSNGTHMDVFLNDDEQKDALLFLKQNGMVPKGFVYLNAGGSKPYKRWPVNKFISLAKTILKNTPLNIVLGGDPMETTRIISIYNHLDSERVTCTTHCSLGLSCALIAQARILVTPDSGPMHIGYALKVPTIGLFWSMDSQGRERNILNGPEYCGSLEIKNDLNAVLFGSFIEINKKNYPRGSYQRLISVNDVWEKILGFL